MLVGSGAWFRRESLDVGEIVGARTCGCEKTARLLGRTFWSISFPLTRPEYRRARQGWSAKRVTCQRKILSVLSDPAPVPPTLLEVMPLTKLGCAMALKPRS
jgi:hypothetical protein